MTKNKKGNWNLQEHEGHILSEGDGRDYYKASIFYNNRTGEYKFFNKYVVDDIGVEKILKMLNKK